MRESGKKMYIKICFLQISIGDHCGYTLSNEENLFKLVYKKPGSKGNKQNS